MNHAADNSSASPPTAETENTAEIFSGFEPLHSNYVFCPNQFFDVCLKSNSRGMVRIVAYLLRQTLGWLDENGLPINETVKVTYRDLIEKAGVSRGAIGKALQQAVACGFIECSTNGQANIKGQASQTAEYTLRWDDNPHYAKSFAEFNGFFAGEGNRTPIPNSFFDWVIPNESLAVTKVVGTVIRHTVGFENRYGGRRISHPMSCSFIQRYALLSNRRNVVEAIRHAEETGYIVKVEEGVFSHRPSEQKATAYGVRWLSEKQNSNSGSKMTPALTRFNNDTRNGSKSSPAERFKNDTSIEKTKPNNTSKQQVAVCQGVQELVAAGFEQSAAETLVRDRGVDVVLRQLKWIDARQPKNRLAMLRKAIENDWDPPQIVEDKKKRESRKQHLANVLVQIDEESKQSVVRKKQRSLRKQRLIDQWLLLDQQERNALISAAAKRQSAEILRKIILKQKPSNDSPSFHVLDELAIKLDLPMVSEVMESPQKEKTNATAIHKR